MPRLQQGRRGRKRGNPNWGKTANELPFMPPIPSEWDKKLAELKLDDKTAEYFVLTSSGVPLRNWVKMHCRNRFIPERILDQLGLTEELGAYLTMIDNGSRTTGRHIVTSGNRLEGN